MSNYSLDTPINRKLYEITERDVPFAPAYQPKPPSETDQTHRNMTWLHHKPRELASNFIATESGRDKKK
jgi:hypothetical protein